MVELPKVSVPETVSEEVANPYGHQDEGLGWAVSYADVLMVLLSFFIVFFSLSKSETSSILNKILLSESVPSDSTRLPNAEVVGDSSKDSANGLVLAKIQDLNLDQGVKVAADGESIVFMLPDNSFRPGAVELDEQGNKILLSLLEKLKKYQSEIDITFIGHSDATVVSHSKNKIIQNNFDLSSIRATRAIDLASKMGFSQGQLKSKASGQFGRDSRTLSIQINVRGKS